jgi:putative tributyrin esterase
MRHHQSFREDRGMSTRTQLPPGMKTNIKRATICLAFYILLPLAAVAQPSAHPKASHVLPAVSPLVRDAHFHSAALSREMRYRIYLPHNYAAATQRYPVLYLLHGLYGNFENWDTFTHLSSYAAGMDWIIVMPDADDSWYTNSATAPQDKFEDYIAKDLIAEIDARYHTIRERHARAIAGLSMGGYAALKLALRDPQSFAFAGSLSGALDAARDLDTRLPEFAAKLMEVFGPAGDPARAQNDIFLLVERASPVELPYLYIACGTEDRFLSVNREFVAKLSQRHANYEYHETAGNHDWTYWDREIRPLMTVMESRLSLKPLQ